MTTDFPTLTDPVDPIRAQIQIFRFWREALRLWHKHNQSPLHSAEHLYPLVRRVSEAESSQDNPSWMISMAADAKLLHEFTRVGQYKLWTPERDRLIEVSGQVVFSPEQFNELIQGTPDWPFDINDEGATEPSIVTSIALNGASPPADVGERATNDEEDTPEEGNTSNPYDPETYTLDVELTDGTPKEIRRLALHLLLWRTSTTSEDPDWRHIEYETAKRLLRRHGVKKPGATLEGMSRGNEPRTKFSTEQVGVIDPMKRLRPVERAHAGLWLKFTDSSIEPEALRATIRETLDYAANQVGGVTRVLIKYGWMSKNRRGKFILQRPMTLPEFEAADEATEPEPIAEEEAEADAVEPETQQDEPPTNGAKSLLQMSRQELEALETSLRETDPEPVREQIDQKRRSIAERTAHASELEQSLATVREQIERERAEMRDLETELETLEFNSAANAQALETVQFHLNNWDVIHAGVPNLPS